MEQKREEREDWIEILKDKSSSTKEKHRCCKQLMGLWEDTADIKAGTYVYYFKAYNFMEQGRIEKVFKESMRALSYAEQLEDDLWIVKMIYNLLGIAASKQGNSLTALNYFMKELAVLAEEETEDYNTYQIVNTNIGCLYAKLGNYKKALHFFMTAKKYIQKDKKCRDAFREAAMYLNLTEAYYKVGRLECARKCAEYVEKSIKNNPKLERHQFTLDILLYVLDREEGYEEQAQKKWEAFVGVRIDEDILSALHVLTEFLLERKEYTQLLLIVSKMEQYGENQKKRWICLQGLEYRLKYFDQMGDKKSLNEACMLYFEMQADMKKEENKGKVQNASAYISLKHMEKQQKSLVEKREILKKKSEYDALTNLKNRYAIQTFSNEMFQKTVEQGVFVLVDMIDVDYFKEYNDNYGHMSGDRCLTLIADEIAKIIGTADLGARYGGDEFLIVQMGKTKEEMQSLVNELRIQIMKCHIPHAYSEAADVVTISQGCFYSVPKEGETLNDFIKEADSALREAKDRKRNKVMINIRDAASS